ncbi:hypothetical protein Kisp02_71620 [Kineosporia sp. NBRC 101731]|nr:hypothetical protein Kisp02_71620 [Kineosporia sp. NBRC 101731]
MLVKLTKVQDVHAARPKGRTGAASWSVRSQKVHRTLSGQGLAEDSPRCLGPRPWSAGSQGLGSASVDLLFYRPGGSEAGDQVLYRAGTIEDVATVIEGPRCLRCLDGGGQPRWVAPPPL